MLANVIGSYVNSLGEREFDAPFMALLRLYDFTDIHFVHGPFEFGKDFIPKRVEHGLQYQYLFQSKAGDVGLADWHACRGQIDMLRTDALSHPNFDATLPRCSVFVITGRLIGAAAPAAQQYREHLKLLGEMGFLTWDRDSLVEMMAAEPRSLIGSPPDLLHILSSTEQALNFGLLETYSRNWMRCDVGILNFRSILEASVIAQHCRSQNRLDSACYVALMLLRSLWATAHGVYPLPDNLKEGIEVGQNLFRHYAMCLWDCCSCAYSDPDELVHDDITRGTLVTYPVKCLIIVEILSLLGLLERKNNQQLSLAIADYISTFVTVNPGAAHPISDRWGISVASCALLLSIFGKPESRKAYLTSIVRWIADRYDNDNFGLAGPHAQPEEEIIRLFGDSMEHIRLSRRSESYLATQILDICSVNEDNELFELARNEFLAVDICLPVLEVDDTAAQYSVTGDSQRYEPNINYEEFWRPQDGWKVAPHHVRGCEYFYPESVGDSWDQIAISAVVRDRHFVQTWRRLVSESRPKL